MVSQQERGVEASHSTGSFIATIRTESLKIQVIIYTQETAGGGIRCKYQGTVHSLSWEAAVSCRNTVTVSRSPFPGKCGHSMRQEG